jgi:hypothetical protein
MLIGTVFLFSWLGTNVLENKYLKQPPHIECSDLMVSKENDSLMIKYEFELFEHYYVNENKGEKRLVERMANTGYLGCYCSSWKQE